MFIKKTNQNFVLISPKPIEARWLNYLDLAEPASLKIEPTYKRNK